MGLPDEIAATRAGTGNPSALVGELRRTAVLVPRVGEEQLLTAAYGGVRWILAFTDEAALARYALTREAPGEPWDYAAVLGARLLDAVIPELGEPAGVAVDVADEDGSMLFPPAPGIVPDAVAVWPVEAAEPVNAVTAAAPAEHRGSGHGEGTR
ncbi:SseB family protein [Streptomyces iconiensis]|uniref:SseB family protein n=1 Tax=Streptomyces iconiensis TaxID=1384038 RepID=A0ABT7A8F7_9ACTN|nr:SseB family protein [Streptomyces iconiensis]MDJ1137629.1 SseB family protein [Streptomyces iconiensis]